MMNAGDRRIPLVILILLGFSLLGPASALAHAAPPADGPADAVSGDALEPFMDAFFSTQLTQTHTPGAVVVVVQNGQIIFSKGYGLANIEAATPMDAGRTVMRLGSISKLFVATAVMQLVEQGRLDLHADVNRYLTAFQVAPAYAQPITLADLLTHTAGVDESWDTSLDPTAQPALGAYLAGGKLRRILPPGEAWYYSGVGYALAAYIVESVTEMPFDQYVAANILRPLGMGSAGYLLAPPLPADLATGYVYRAGVYEPQPVDYYGDYPSSSMAASAGDAARFMLAMLGGGCHAGACILRPETLAEMQRQQYAPHPQLDGHTYGFVETRVNGVRHIGHSGAIRGFGSYLTLVPERGLGYFVSFNQECMNTSACSIISELRQQFAERFFTASVASPPAARPTTPPAALTGSYRLLALHLARAYRDTVYKLTLLDYDVRVTADSAGLLVDGVRYVEIEPLLFQSAAGARIAFRQDSQGKTRYLLRPTPNQKLAWYETAAFTRPMFYIWGALWIVAGLAWPARLLVRRWRGGRPATRLEHVAHGLLSLMAALNVAFLLSLTRLFWISRTATTIWLTLPLIAIGLAVAALATAGLLWRRGAGAKGWRAYYAAMMVLAGGFALVLNSWNLIGFKFG